MASKKTKVVDGFTAIRAAQEAARHGHGDPLRPDADKKTDTPRPEAAAKAGARIGKSVLPSKREIICPQCGYVSEVTGKLQLFVCQGCRHRMKLDDVTLPEGDWSAEIETGGDVTVPAGTILKGGKITANDIHLHGKMEGAELRASRRIRVHKGAVIDWVRANFRDLEIGPGLNITPGKPLDARNIELHGAFCGNLRLTGTLTIHPPGDFSGQVRAAGLTVHEGGGLRASLDINPEHAPPPQPPQPKSPSRPLRKSLTPPPKP
ncbi:MAG: polymer-forming cytoskeletal protein [Kiritimatiellae bacterium]|nr:polymer-forming cytoskeletal protein [Kiritimatiellia bacterium]